jgi:hypothetical protein
MADPTLRMLQHRPGGSGSHKNPSSAQGGWSLETLKSSKNPIKAAKPLQPLQTDRVKMIKVKKRLG